MKNSRPAIVICSNIIWTIVVFRRYILRELVNTKFKIYVISSKESFNDVDIKEFEEQGVEFIFVNVARSSITPLGDIVYLLNLLKILHRIRPSVAFTFTIKPNIYGSIACRILGIASVSTITGLGSAFMSPSFMQRVLTLMYRFALGKSRKVLFQNYDDLKLFTENNIVPADIAGYVPGSGININDYDLPHRDLSSSPVFLFAGRLLKDKGLYEYVSAIRLLKTRHANLPIFLLGGLIDKSNPSGVSEEEIRIWESEGLLKYIGKTSDILSFFAQVDFVVLPSYREGLSRLLLEAASCRRVLIVTDVPGCREIVKDNFNGFLCKAMDAETLSLAFEKAMALTAGQYSLFAENSRKIVAENFTHSKVNEVYISTLSSIIKR